MPVPRRASSVAVLALLLAGSFVAIIPQASASPDSVSVVVDTFTIDGVPATTSTVAKHGSEIHIVVTATATAGSGCNVGTTGIAAIKRVTLKDDNVGADESFTQIGTTSQWQTTFNIDQPSGTGATRDRVSGYSFTIVAVGHCNNAVDLPDKNEVPDDTTTSQFILDNKRPEGTAVFSFIASGTDAGMYGITLAPGAGAVSATANLVGIGGSTSQALTPFDTTRKAFPIGTTASAPNTVSVTYNDLSGNTQETTLAAPTRVENFQVIPLSGGIARIHFTSNEAPAFTGYAVAYRPSGGTTWTVATPGAGLTRIADDGTTIRHELSGLTIGTTYEVRAFVQKGGNDGVPTDARTVTPQNAPNSLLFMNPPNSAGAQLVGTVSGTWAGPGSPTDIRVSLRRTVGGVTEYWQGGAGNVFSTTEKSFSSTITGNSWTTSAFAPTSAYPDGTYTLVAEFLTVAGSDPTLPHTFILDATDYERLTRTGAGVPPTNVFVPPLATAQPFTAFQQEFSTPRFYMAVKDPAPATGSEFSRIEFTLRSATSPNPIATNPLTGEQVILTCHVVTSLSDGCGFIGDLDEGPAGELDANVSLFLPPTLLGDFKWEIRAYDAADNPVNLLGSTNALSSTFTIGPRVTLVNAPVVVDGFTVYDRPAITASGQLTFDVFTSWTGLSSISPQATCVERSTVTSYSPQRPCRVTGLEIWARNRSATGTAANGQLVANLPIPTRGPSAFLWEGLDDPFLYYEHSPQSPTQVDGIHPWFVEVKAIAKVQTGATSSNVVQLNTTWIRALPPDVTSALAINLPPNNSTVYLEHTFTFPNGNVHPKMFFNVTFDQSSLPAAPALKYTVWKTGSKEYLDLADGSLERVTLTSDPGEEDDPALLAERTTELAPVSCPTCTKKAPYYSFNWTNGPQNMPRGEYILNASLVSPDGTLLGTATRFFGIEQAPTTNALGVAFDLDESQVVVSPAQEFDGGFVHKTFDVNVTVAHGLQNLTGAHNFQPKLVVQNTNPGSTGTRTIIVPTDGFGFELRELTQIDAENSRAWLNITLPPSNATDGARFDLIMNVSSDSWNKTNLGRANGTSLLTVVVDTVPPAPAVLRDASNRTGDGRNGDLSLIGFVQDTGSGAQTVEVRIYDATKNKTFVWDSLGAGGNGAWKNGLLESWLSSDLREDKVGREFADVQLFATGDPTLLTWVVEAGPRVAETAPDGVTPTLGPLALDRTSHYVVDVRAQDLLNDMSLATRHDVMFDRLAPNVTARLVQASQGTTPGATGFVGWHGAAKVRAQVQDNNCIEVAAIWSKLPSGRVVGPFNMSWDETLNAGTPQLCGEGTGDDKEWWQLDLAKAPLATDEVGVVELTLMVEDAAGHRVNDSRTLNLTVLDSAPAEIQDVFLEPPVVPEGGGSRVVAYAWDNRDVKNVTAILYQRGGDGSLTELGRGNMTQVSGQTDANGIGNWTISTSDIGVAALPLGNYQWLLRPVDSITLVDCGEQDCLAPRATISCSPDCKGRTEIFQALADVGVIIQQDAPASGSGFVNATPTLRWKVFAKSVTASDVTLLAGNTSTTMTAVDTANLTVADLPPIGTQRTGIFVEYRPTLTGESLAVQLKATSNGATNQTAVVTYEVDLTPPNATVDVTGDVPLGGKRWATDGTRVAIVANDTHPGPITYFVNGVGPTVYSTAITPLGAIGDWKLDYTAADAAGNKVTGTITLSLDRKGPVVTPSQNGDKVVVTVTDEGVGLNESTVVIHYAYGDQAFASQAMEKQGGNVFGIQLTGNASVSGLKYYFEARDLLGNLGGSNATAAAPIVIRPDSPVDDLPPTLRITLPTANQTVSGDSVELKWLASDPENKSLSITIALREPGNSGRVLQTAGANNGTWRVDLAGKPDGAYALVVTASDGAKTAQETVPFTIQHRQLIEVPTPPPSVAEPNKAVPIAIKVNADKTVASATYTVVRDNQTVSSGVMGRGPNGTYTANVLPTEPGDYKVLVTVSYADGTSEPAQQVGSFQVAGGPVGPGPGAPALPPSLITLVVLALATIALAAYAVVRWKP